MAPHGVCLDGWLATLFCVFLFGLTPTSTPRPLRPIDTQTNRETSKHMNKQKQINLFTQKCIPPIFLYRSQAAGQPVSQAASQPARQATLRTLPPKKRFQEKKRAPCCGGALFDKSVVQIMRFPEEKRNLFKNLLFCCYKTHDFLQF